MRTERKRAARPARGRAGTPVAPEAPSRRRDIREQALRLMEEKGFAAVSVQHLADALEFSKANFYHHVESKERLLHDIFIEILDFSLGRIETIVGGDGTFPAKLKNLIEFYVSLMTDRRAVMLVWFKERAHLTGRYGEDVAQFERKLSTALRRFYSSGIKQGAFRDMNPDLLRHAVFGMCFMLTKMPQPVQTATKAAITRQLQEFATAGLVAR